MVKKCLYCGRFFETTSGIQKYCSVKCSKQNRKETENYADEYLRKKNREYFQTKKDKLKQYADEALECHMSYGKYRMMRDVFGKSFEELKNAY